MLHHARPLPADWSADAIPAGVRTRITTVIRSGGNAVPVGVVVRWNRRVISIRASPERDSSHCGDRRSHRSVDRKVRSTEWPRRGGTTVVRSGGNAVPVGWSCAGAASFRPMLDAVCWTAGASIRLFPERDSATVVTVGFTAAWIARCARPSGHGVAGPRWFGPAGTQFLSGWSCAGAAG